MKNDIPVAVIQRSSKYLFKLKEPLTMSGVSVPVGFETDLASVPRFLWSILPPMGNYLEAAIVHDFMYRTSYKTKSYADNVFRENMKRYGVKKWKVKTMYFFVRLFGRGSYSL